MAADAVVFIDAQERFVDRPDLSPPPLVWENRVALLGQKFRWGDWPVMYYRTNLHVHGLRVAALTQRKEFLIPVLHRFPDLDTREVYCQGEYHDDHELTDLGDVSLRRKLLMNTEQLTDHQMDEIIAIQEIDRAFATRDGRRRMVGRHPHRYSHHDILTHAVQKDTVASQYCSIIDKMVEGFSEGMHEVLAGNSVFVEAVVNYLEETRRKVIEKCFYFSDMLLDPKGPFSLPPCSLQEYFEKCRKAGSRPGRPHTRESVSAKTGILFYDVWKEVTIELFGYDPLIVRRESYSEGD